MLNHLEKPKKRKLPLFFFTGCFDHRKLGLELTLALRACRPTLYQVQVAFVFFTACMVSWDAPKKRSKCGAVSAICAMMLYLMILPTKIANKIVQSLILESFPKKIRGWRMIGIAETGTAAIEPYDCIMPSVQDHHLLVKVAGKDSFHSFHNQPITQKAWGQG